MPEDYLTDTGRKLWRDEDFIMLYAFIRDVRSVMESYPNEVSSVIVDDAIRASNALTYISRGVGR